MNAGQSGKTGRAKLIGLCTFCRKPRKQFRIGPFRSWPADVAPCRCPDNQGVISTPVNPSWQWQSKTPVDKSPSPAAPSPVPAAPSLPQSPPFRQAAGQTPNPPQQSLPLTEPPPPLPPPPSAQGLAATITPPPAPPGLAPTIAPPPLPRGAGPGPAPRALPPVPQLNASMMRKPAPQAPPMPSAAAPQAARFPQ